VAQAFGVSESTIRRWIRRMGYRTWEDFLLSATDEQVQEA
jgi:DNA-binding MurR/RpiR family transcriptional regulator